MKAASTKRVSRLNYALRTLLVTTMALAIEFLGDDLLHLDLLPYCLYALQAIIVFALFGRVLMPTIEGRLLDMGAPKQYKLPVCAVWLASISIIAIWPNGRAIGLILFALLLIGGCSVPSGKSALAPIAEAPVFSAHDDEAQASGTMGMPRFPSRLLVNRHGFLRILVTIACLWLPLIWLGSISGDSAAVWFARFGYAVLSVVWLLKALGRLADAGRLPRARYGYLAIGFVFLISTLPRTGFFVWDEHPSLLILTRWFSFLNGYEVLALFLLLQIPLALLPTKARCLEVASGTAEIHSKESSRETEANQLSLRGPTEYLRILLVISAAWIPFIYMDRASGGGVGTWIARGGYIVLGIFWLIFANGRLADAGWDHSSYPSQYFLVVSVSSLMPLALHLVNAYGALVIFVLIQTPILFLKSKPPCEAPASSKELHLSEQ